jgi:hypothetical protein
MPVKVGIHTFNPVTNQTTFLIHYTTPSTSYPMIVGKIVRDHVCGATGHEDETRNLNSTPNDVLEVPDVSVKLRSNRRVWTYGTVRVGVNYGPMIWKDHTQVFTSHTQQTNHILPTAALDLGRPNRLKKDVLNQHPVDCLLIEGESTTKWVPWVIAAEEVNKPSAILCFIDKELLDHDDGPVPKA